MAPDTVTGFQSQQQEIHNHRLKINYKIIHFATKRTDFNIIVQNMQSIYGKRDTLRDFLQGNHSNIHALCATETWLSEAKLQLMEYAGYNIAAAFCRHHRKGSRTIILLRDDFEYTEITEIADLTIE